MDEIIVFLSTYILLFLLYTYVDIFNSLIGFIATATFLLRFCAILARYLKQYLPNKSYVNPKNKIVLVTGCDSGFGLEIAKRLDYYGFYVLAGVLSKQSEGAKVLDKYCSKRLKIIQLDVTNEEDINNTLDLISYLTNYKPVLDKLEEKESKLSIFDRKFKNTIYGNEDGDLTLWAIVNNAGLGYFLPIEFGTINDYEKLINVNLIGLIKITLTFLPLIRRSKGRLVHMGSIYSDLVTICSSQYAITKSGVKAFNTGLRQELNPFGVKSILIKPSFYQTPLCKTDNIVSRFMDIVKNTDSLILKEYRFDLYSERFIHLIKKFFDCSNKNINEVVDQVEDAITNSSPKDVYSPGRLIEKIIIWFLEQLNTKFFDFITFKIFRKLF